MPDFRFFIELVIVLAVFAAAVGTVYFLGRD